MPRPVGRHDIAWAYAAQLLNVGAGIALLPAVIRYLSPAEVGLWFVFLTLGSLAQLLELGFQPALARNVAYVLAGVKTISHIDLPQSTVSDEPPDRTLLATVINAGKRIYGTVAVTSGLLLLTLGTSYIWIVSSRDDVHQWQTAWMIFCGSQVAGLYFGYLTGVLNGSGNLTPSNKVIVLTRALLIILGTAGLAQGFGLLGLSLAALGSIAAGRALGVWYARRAGLWLHAADKNSVRQVIQAMSHNALRQGAVQLGGFLTQRSSILIASSFLGLAAAGSYGLTVTLLLALSAIALVPCQVHLPLMNSLQARGDRAQLSAIYGEVLLSGWTLFTAGVVVLTLTGNQIIGFVGGSTRLLASWEIAVLGLVLLLELNHSMAATYITTLNKVPFVKAALLSGTAISVLAILLVGPLGTAGLIAAHGVVQLAYNNWKWPVQATAHLGEDIWTILGRGRQRLFQGHIGTN